MALFRNGGNFSLSGSEFFLVPPEITGKTDFAILLLPMKLPLLFMTLRLQSRNGRARNEPIGQATGAIE